MVFGALDDWLSDDVDVETWTFDGDAGRLFLRGQWTLQRIGLDLWRECRHLSTDLDANIRHKLNFFHSRKTKKADRLASDATDNGRLSAREAALEFPTCSPAMLSRFNSAEACYSCVIFSSNLTVRVSPLLFSDHSEVPVYWRRKFGLRRRQLATTANLPTKETAKVRLDCSDMRWICRSTPRAALQLDTPLGPDDVVLWQRGAATVVRSATNATKPAFHFRKWVDYGTFDVVTPPPQLTAFVVHPDGIHPQRRRRRRPGALVSKDSKEVGTS